MGTPSLKRVGVFFQNQLSSFSKGDEKRQIRREFLKREQSHSTPKAALDIVSKTNSTLSQTSLFSNRKTRIPNDSRNSVLS